MCNVEGWNGVVVMVVPLPAFGIPEPRLTGIRRDDENIL